MHDAHDAFAFGKGLQFLAHGGTVRYYNCAGIPQQILYRANWSIIIGMPLVRMYEIAFRIYKISIGDAPIWEEFQTITLDAGSGLVLVLVSLQ